MSFFKKEIIYFMEISRVNSLKVAAKNLDVSISSLSKSMSALENKLGVKLFFRRAQGMVLTQDGEILYDRLIEGYKSINKAYRKFMDRSVFEVAITSHPPGIIRELLCRIRRKGMIDEVSIVRELIDSSPDVFFNYDIFYVCDVKLQAFDYFVWGDFLVIISLHLPNYQGEGLKLVQSKQFSTSRVFKECKSYLNSNDIRYSVSIVDDLELRIAMVESGEAQMIMPSSFDLSDLHKKHTIYSFPCDVTLNHYLYCNQISPSIIHEFASVFTERGIDWTFKSILATLADDLEL